MPRNALPAGASRDEIIKVPVRLDEKERYTAVASAAGKSAAAWLRDLADAEVERQPQPRRKKRAS